MELLDYTVDFINARVADDCRAFVEGYYSVNQLLMYLDELKKHETEGVDMTAIFEPVYRTMLGDILKNTVWLCVFRDSMFEVDTNTFSIANQKASRQAEKAADHAAREFTVKLETELGVEPRKNDGPF